MSEKKLGLKAIITQLPDKFSRFRHYIFPVFLVVVGLIYGYMLLNINNLVNATPSDADVSSQVKAAHIPRIDEDVVQQLESLKDNSVSVQSLFEESRNNPFQ